ncbi:MAG: M4 family metallopeptidase [Pyrinomonadaceae bacterium]
MKRKSAVLVAITLSILILPFQTIQGQGQSEVPSSPTGPDGQGASSISRQETFQLPINKDGKSKGWVTKFYRKERSGGIPPWVTIALGRSLAYLRQHRSALGLLNAEAEIEINAAEEDDLGITHIRFDQVSNGVPIFGGRLMTHLDTKYGQPPSHHVAGDVLGVEGRWYKDARGINSNPTLDSAQAIEAAKIALGYTGMFAKSPEAELVILPHQIKNEFPSDRVGATLVYKVELLIEDGTDATARHWYFVNAHDGSIVWHYDAMNRGAGQSLYSGYVSIPSDYYSFNTTRYDPTCGQYLWNNGYWLYDGTGTYGYMEATDMQNMTGGDPTFAGYAWARDRNDAWGVNSGYPCDRWQREQAMVDVQFGMALTWNYFLYQHGRRGIDNTGYRMFGRTHYGVNIAQAFWNGANLSFGDGVASRPWVSIDIVAHEWSHGVTEKTAGLYNAQEAGAANESFSDIFGTMVEFLGNNHISPPDYLIGEDFGTPLRSLANPPAYGGRDHYNNRLYPGYCTPVSGGFSGNDNCGVHRNNGIQNKAFYLLAEGGTHPYSGVQVTGIGRDAASRIFFRALTLHLPGIPNATLHDARLATVNAAFALYGYRSANHDATSRAWDAVGVPANKIDESWFFVQQDYLDTLGRWPDQNGWQDWANYINACGANNPQCINSRRITTARGFLESWEFRHNKPALANPSTPAEYNQEYVRQCYLVFLRRSPDPGGYNGWVDHLNRTSDYDTLVGGFINSAEYRRRACCGG